MNSDAWLLDRTIYLTKHGSQAYGLNNETSDLDIKGICVPPLAVEHDLFHRFDQAENSAELAKRYAELVNPLNPKLESTVYSLAKFFKLAAEVNPNVIELLFTDPSDWLTQEHPAFSLLLHHRDMFLSSKAKYTFTGYASAQIAKIERHRKWLLNPSLVPPTREEFGLPKEQDKSVLPIFGAMKKTIESWILSIDGIDPMSRQELQDRCFDALNLVGTSKIKWDNWPDYYTRAAADKVGADLNLPTDTIQLLHSEIAFKKAQDAHSSYLTWKRTRNPQRAVLEEKFGWDCKHGMHLVRLLHMGLEILEGKGVIVKRPDREFLLEIRNGVHSYETIMDHADQYQEKINSAYHTTELPRSVDKVKLNKLYLDIKELMPDGDSGGIVPA